MGDKCDEKADATMAVAAYSDAMCWAIDTNATQTRLVGEYAGVCKCNIFTVIHDAV